METYNNNLENKKKTTIFKDVHYGKIISDCSLEESVVISGMAGRFPMSRNVKEYIENLLNKVDMVTPSKWSDLPSLPKRHGQLVDTAEFDNSFFGIPYWIAYGSDPMLRKLLESTVEAIFDAGLNPKDLEGTKTGVFVGVCYNETGNMLFQHNNLTGSFRTMLSNQISYFLKLKGPSYVIDTACSSSLYAVEHAYRAIRSGECDSAIVGGTNLCLHPNVSYQFFQLGVLNREGASKSFDNSGNGYARAEGICAVILQKSKDAKRIYGKIVHAKTNCDGYKERGITFPSGEMQTKCLKECYEEANIHPNEISYIEAHGTGTVVGDPEEAKALDEALCKRRDKPLLIGACKSNIGHTEPAAGLCSIIKCLFALESGIIPPNLHYSEPRAGIKALEEGRLKVVTEKTPLPKGKNILGVSSFGFGGGNCHVILSSFAKEKINNSIPKDDIPRLICVSGRVPESIEIILDQASMKNGFDSEFVRLLHEVFRFTIDGHHYRGFSIVSKNGELLRSHWLLKKNLPHLFFEFCGLDNWDTVGEQFLQMPIFASTIQNAYNILSLKNINVKEILTQKSKKSLREHIMGSIIIQLGIVDILKGIDLKPKFIFGYGINELVAAYQDEVLSLKEVLESAFLITSLCENPSVLSVYFVEATVEVVKQIVPASVKLEILPNSKCIVYCPMDISANFSNNIKSSGIQMNNLGIKLDYGCCTDKKDSLVKQLNNIISNPKKWSSKHLISPNVIASPEYFANCLLHPFNSNIFQKTINKRSIIVQVGSSYLEILNKDNVLKKVDYLQLLIEKDSVISFLKVLGRLFENGFSMQINKLYPDVKFPVSRGTPSLSSNIKWRHVKKWFIPFNTRSENSNFEERVFKFNAKHPIRNFLAGHVVNGRNLFPAAGYIRFVWEVFALMENKMVEQMKVAITNCRFIRATPIPKEGSFILTVMIQKNSGNFEIIEGNAPVVTGNIKEIDDDENSNLGFPKFENCDNHVKMTTKDIYKELRLRGYHYTGRFRAIKECNISASEGLIKWEDNFISFIDNMFQMKILRIDTRLLFVPTVISKITIDAKKHIELIKSLGENSCVPVHLLKEADVIRSGGIQVIGLKANSIAKRKILSDPVIEKHIFVANESNELKLEDALRVNVQLLLENFSSTKLKIVEVIDEVTNPNSKPLAPIVNSAVSDLPVVKAETIILSASTEYENCDNITIENKPLGSQPDSNLIIGSKFLSRPLFLQQAFRVLKENCYIISREPKDIDLVNINKDEVKVLTAFTLETERIVLLRRTKRVSFHEIINISKTEDFSWLESVKSTVKKDNHVVILSQGDNINGILGFINCLRREANPERIKCVFLMDSAPPFNLKDKFYSEQLEKNLAINIYKNGQWGTYRHLLLKHKTIINCDHSFVNINTPGDLSSLTWVQGKYDERKQPTPEKSLVNIYYAALNFRDIMTATGKINSDVITMDRLQECFQGLEFSGRLQNGKRVMGMANCGALANLIETENVFLWPVPPSWSMQEAATVPVCYVTVAIAMLDFGKLKKGQTILIHSGTGGIGQAAINVALFYGCTVFTTVGTPEKREFLKKQFPQLKDSHIACSRNLSFVTQIMKETNGKGVNMVLNSLAEEKLLASVSCLAENGQFLEIGKFDLAHDNQLRLMLIKKNASFHGIVLDSLFNINLNKIHVINKHLTDLINAGAVKPLNANLFQAEDVEKAFRFMGAGKHMGKVLLEIRKEESSFDKNSLIDLNIKTDPRYYCNENNTSIIIGGLGGFGLELTDWLVIRGAKKIILTSRTGVQNGYQAYRLKIWKSYGVKVLISTDDATTKEGCTKLLRKANELGNVEAIFNLAVVLKDAIIENQDEESFKTSFAPKAVATKYLDKLSREMCPSLRLFVVFSSVSCGRGNAGQTNYGMANSVMERICEKRQQEGYPGLAIQWGAVGDVGLVADMQEEHKELEIGGTLQQGIVSCLKVLDSFLTQKNVPVVSSMVVAEKRIGGADNILDVVTDILGIKNLKAISLHMSFPEIGMDSMTAVEIKQTLERDFEIFLTPQDIRELTFSKLIEMQERRSGDNRAESVPIPEVLGGKDFLLRIIGDEKINNIPVLNLKSMITDKEDLEPVLFFPGIEGVATIFNPLVEKLYVKAYGIQFGCVYEKNSIQELAEAMIPYITPQLKSKSFKFVAYSFGVLFALEVVSILESLGYEGTLICIDGAPQYIKELANLIEFDSEETLQTNIICKILSAGVKLKDIDEVKISLENSKSLDERIAICQQLLNKKLEDRSFISVSHFRQLAVNAYKRIKGVINYSPSFTKIKSKVVLIKCKFTSFKGLTADYNMSKVCGQDVEVIEVEGNHITVLDSPEADECINKLFAVNNN